MQQSRKKISDIKWSNKKLRAIKEPKLGTEDKILILKMSVVIKSKKVGDIAVNYEDKVSQKEKAEAQTPKKVLKIF